MYYSRACVENIENGLKSPKGHNIQIVFGLVYIEIHCRPNKGRVQVV